MAVLPPADLKALVEGAGQAHLLARWEELDASQRSSLERQLRSIDFPLVSRLTAEGRARASDAAEVASKAQRAAPPAQVIRQPQTDADRGEWIAARRIGEELLQGGRVGAILVAGGQGSRLGFDKPKGMFPIGPVSDRTLFHIFCEQLLALGRKYGKPIPYFVMTSEATHADTVAFFEQHKFFGLDPKDVYFFQQGALPAVDDATGRILLAEKDQVSLSPDGHGGILKALKRSGLIDVMEQRGLEVLYYHQVDNPTAPMCDPAFLGFHKRLGSQMTTKVVAKESAEEKMGVLVSLDGRTQIIEYSDLPVERARAVDAAGGLLLWAGNTAVHAFDRAFLARITSVENALPFHIAHKPVPYIDAAGSRVEPRPDQKNAYKFEQFIFDVLPLTDVALVVEGDRKREFNPVKNATGKDSPETSRAALCRNAADLLRDAGVAVRDGVKVEISPLFAMDSQDVRMRHPAGAAIEKDTVLGPV